MFDKKIIIYSLSTCGHCKSAKKFFNDNSIDYEYIDVDMLDKMERKKVLNEVKNYNERCSFPTIIIGDTVIVGFQEEKIKEALG